MAPIEGGDVVPGALDAAEPLEIGLFIHGPPRLPPKGISDVER
jgi:hypothetical protein